MTESCYHEVKAVKILWQKYPKEMIKLNTNGSALGNLRKSGVGGICRNNCGDLIFAFTSPNRIASYNPIKIEASIFGLTWCQ